MQPESICNLSETPLSVSKGWARVFVVILAPILLVGFFVGDFFESASPKHAVLFWMACSVGTLSVLGALLVVFLL